MKRLTSLFFILAVAFTYSCKKDYVCECTTTVQNPVYSSVTINTHNDKGTNRQMEKNCTDQSYDQSSGVSIDKKVCVVK